MSESHYNDSSILILIDEEFIKKQIQEEHSRMIMEVTKDE